MAQADPLKVVELLDEAFNCGDIEAILDFYEDGAVMVIEPGRLATGKDELRRTFEWMLTNIKGVAKQERTHVITAGDIALFLSKWSYTGASVDGAPFSRESYATVILRKGAEERWRIVVDNSWGLAVLE
jgi:uncharacterized protein (TIGR02246 family)